MAEIERLTVVWDANFARMNDKLDKVIRSNAGAAKRVEGVWDKTTIGKGLRGRLDGIASAGPAAALGLNTMTTAGLLAGASLGALAIAAAKAIEAMSFGDELQTAADKLQITAEALQVLQFQADETDVPIDSLREAIFKLDGAIGAMKTGVGSAKVEKIFDALKITDDDLKGITNGAQLLPLLADRLGQVGDVAAQVQLARKLGIENILPLLRLGSDGLKEMEDRARALGLVLSNETVKGLAEADRQMELASQQIKTNLRGAFSGLATDIAGATTELAKFLLKIKQFEDKHPTIGRILNEIKFRPGPAFIIPGVIKGLKGPGAVDALPTTPKSAGELSADILETFGPKAPGFEFDPQGGDKGAAGKAASEANQRRQRERQLAQEIFRIEEQLLESSRSRAASAQDLLEIEYSRLQAARAQRDEEIDQLQADYKRTGGLEGLSETEAAQLRLLEDQLLLQQRNNIRLEALREARDRALALEAQLADATLEQLRAAEEMAAGDVERRRIQVRILELERAEGRAALERRLQEDPDVSDADRARQLAAFDETSRAQRNARIAQGLRDAREKALELETELLGYTLEQLQVADGLATTQAERRRIQLRMLELEREQERKALEAHLQAQGVDPAERQRRLQGFDAATDARRQGVLAGTQGPLDEFLDRLPQTAEEINEVMESIAADGLKSLEDGLVGVIQGTEDLGDVFKRIAAQIIADLARIAIQQAIIGPLSALVASGGNPIAAIGASLFGGGRAGGGPVSPGKLYRVNEMQGGEWFAPSVAGTIHPGSMARTAGAARPVASTVIHQYTTRVVNYGPTTKEFLGFMSQVARGEARGVGSQVAAAGVRGIPGAITFHQKMGGFG